LSTNYKPPNWLEGVDPNSLESLRTFVEENFKRTTEAGFWWEPDDDKAMALSDKIHDDMMLELREYLEWWGKNNS